MDRNYPTPLRASRSTTLRAAAFTLQRKCNCGQHTVGGAECEECNKKETVQRHSHSSSGATTVPSIVYEVLGSPGQPLDASTRSLMDPRFGHDFSGVRVHTDARAAESAQLVGAPAYTFGKSVVFDSGQYAPATSSGRQLLAHELAHVVQQSKNAEGTGSVKIVDSQDSSEHEADRVARHVFDGGPAFPRVTMPASLARKDDDKKKDKEKEEKKAPLEKGKDAVTEEGNRGEKAGACVPPTGVTLGRTEVLDLSSYLTGGGTCAVMKVTPAEANLCPGITEDVGQAEGGTCPSSLLKPSLCSGHSTFPLGKAQHGACSAVKPEATEFVDRHSTQLAAVSVLHDETRNPRKLNSCTFNCKQRYFIASGKTSTTLGNFLISYSLVKTKRDGKDATEVTVSKKAAGTK